MTSGVFETWAPVYRERSLWARPIDPGTKACRRKGWSKPDPDWEQSELESWQSKFANHGIGLLLGAPTGDGTVLGALDIDHDDYVRVAQAMLGPSAVGRVGARGAAFFVRVRGDMSYRGFTAKGDEGDVKVGELLVRKRLIVLPPTIHPATNKPYRWLGTPLHEVEVEQLPIIEV